jgi:para-nitrobenzyl esterase
VSRHKWVANLSALSFAASDGSVMMVLSVRNLSLAAALVSTSVGPAVSEAEQVAPTVVTIDAGTVRGIAADGIIRFKGIPYAAPPVGPLRWRAPQPMKTWQGIRAAEQFGPSCMQPRDLAASEDCLTLNIWRPAATLVAPLPVMVWIHGGALEVGGSTDISGDTLARQGVIVVSMNYRLGRLGFFAHPALLAETPDELHGNYGYMDQLSALQWIKRNISAFGGDPSAVTIFGESAGGGSVVVHLTSPLSRGLFQRAIMQSAAIPTSRAKVTPLTELTAAEQMAVEYARSIKVEGDGQTALNALRALPARKLVEGASRTGLAGAIRDGKLVVETPEAVLAAGGQAMVPVIIGANDRDLGIGVATSKQALFALFGPDADEAGKLYESKGDQTFDELKQQAFVDKTMFEPARHLADEMVRAGQPAWVYRFSYVPEAERGEVKGALHAREIAYAFGNPAAQVGGKATAADKAMGELVSAYWVSFGKSGDPNGERRPEWPQHKPGASKIIDFTNKGAIVGPDPLEARLDLWEKLWRSAP